MNMFKIIIGVTLILCSINIASCEWEIIDGDTIYINNEEVFISATPHTLHESGNVTFIIETKKYAGDVDLIWGFNKATAKISTIKYDGKEKTKMKKPKNKIVNKNHLLYTDEKQKINSNQQMKVTVWVNVSFNSKGKYDFMIKPSYLTIDQAKELNQLYILDPWWDSTFTQYKEIYIDNSYDWGEIGYQCNVNITYNNNMQNDFGDIRFVDMRWSPYVLSYWVENKVDGEWCNVWFKAKSIGAHTWDNTSHRMYYGNAAVSSLSSIENTFIQGKNNSTTSYNFATDAVIPFIFETRCYHTNSATLDTIGVSSGAYINEGASIELSNAHIMNTRVANNSATTTVLQSGAYFTLADYKIDVVHKNCSFYVNDIFYNNISTNTPDINLGIRYTRGATPGYAEWGFIRKYTPIEPVIYIGDDISRVLKYNLTSNINNTVYTNGRIVSEEGFYSNWSASALADHANVTITNYDNGKGDFTITYGTLDYLEISGFINESIVLLYQNNREIESGTIINNVFRFNTDLPTGDYSINIITYDNITGVHGFVYEGVLGSDILLDDVVIYIYNDTWSDTSVTGGGGYYSFTNLSNTTYTLNFKKDRYKEVLYQYVTPVNLLMYYKNIYMQKSTGDYYSRHYCTFILKDIFGTKYPYINTVVYKDNVIDSSSITGYDGSVVFHLFEDEEYRITFINETQEIDEEIKLSPRDDRYIIWVGNYGFSPENDTRLNNVNYWWTKEEINLSTSWLNFSYKNTDNKTTFIEYWINDTNNTNLFYTSQVYPCSSGIYTSNNIVNSSNNTYVVHFSAHHPDYPGLENSVVKTFSFYTGVLIDLLFTEQWHYTILSLVIIMLIGTLFGATNAPKGSLLMVLATWFLSFVNWLPTSTIGYAAIVLATILAVGWNLKKSETVNT